MTTGQDPPSASVPPAESAPSPPSAYLQRLLDSLPAALIVIDDGGTIRYAAGQLERLGGRTYADLVGTKMTDYVPTAGDRELVEQLLLMAVAAPDGGMVGPVQLRYLDVAGADSLTEAWAVNRGTDPAMNGVVLLLLADSAYDRFDRVLMSVVEGARLEQALGELAAALRYPPVEGEGYFLVPGDDDRRVVRAPDLEEVPGPPLAGPWDEVWAGASAVEHENPALLPEQLAEAARAAGYQSVSCFGVRPGADGRPEGCLVVWGRAASRLSPVARLAVERAVVVASLTLAHHAAEAGRGDGAYRDTLTGIGNRRSFFETLDAQVQAGEQPAILYIDLDGFKEVKDGLGQLAGDAVLRVTARRLTSAMRPTDELARLGGDKFGVLCNGGPSAEQMVRIAERVIAQLSRPLSVSDGDPVYIGASVGIALDLPVGTPIDAILRRADQSLDVARAKGRSQWGIAAEEI